MSPCPLCSSPSPLELSTATNHMAHKHQRFVVFGTSQGRGQWGGQRGCRNHTGLSHYSHALRESFQSMGLFVLPPGSTGDRVVGVQDQAHPHNTLQETHPMAWHPVKLCFPPYLAGIDQSQKMDGFYKDGQMRMSGLLFRVWNLGVCTCLQGCGIYNGSRMTWGLLG